MTDRDTLPAPRRPGLALYCDSHDTSPRYRDATIATLARAGAVRAIAMVEGITGERGSRLVPLDQVRAFVDACHGIDVDVTACAFPDVREEHAGSIAHLLACLDIGCDELELDAEPRAGEHWTRARLRPWLDAVRGLVLTTTRIEAPHIGRLDVPLRLQLEQLTSTSTLADALERAQQVSPIAMVQPVIGTFDQRGQVRTVAMVRRDLARCTEQAVLGGGLAAWAAHTTDEDEADAMREWALATWAPPRAA